MHHHKRHLVSRSSKQQAKDKRRNIAKVFKTSAIANRDRIPQVWFLLSISFLFHIKTTKNFVWLGELLMTFC